MPAGRPTVMTDEVISKLEHAFSMGCTDKEACLYAGISTTPFYEYQQEFPEFKERKEMLKESVTLHARLNLSGSIMGGDVDNSKWHLERKKKDEFSTRTESTGKDGEPLQITVSKRVFTAGTGDE